MYLTSKLGEYTFKYIVEKEDVVFLLRAVEFEGEIKVQIATTLVNYFMALGAHRNLGTVTHMAETIQSYAQPINPAWFVTGGAYLKKVKAATTDQQRVNLLKEANERSEQYQATKFSKTTKEAVYAALKGCQALASFPYVTEYAAKDQTTDPIERGFKLKYSATSKKENNLWHNPKQVKISYQGYTNPEPEKVEQEMEAWDFDTSSGDIRTSLGVEHKYYLNQQTSADNRTAYRVRLQPIAGQTSTLVDPPPPVNEITGTYSPSLAQKALQNFLVGQRRALAMAGSSRKAFYESSGQDVAAKIEVFTTKTANLVKESEAVLSLPTVLNAIGFDPATGEWVRRTNTTTIVTSTAPQPAVPPTSGT